MIDFKSYEDILKAYLFVKEFNDFAKKENEENNKMLYIPLYKAESELETIVKREDRIISETEDSHNPFKRKTRATNKREIESPFTNHASGSFFGSKLKKEDKPESKIVKGFEIFDEKTKIMNDENIVYYDDIVLEND